MTVRTARPSRRRLSLRTWAAAVIGLVTAYLLLERSHAEEVGTGSRVVAEILKGERPLSPLTWLTFGVLATVLFLTGRDRVAVAVPVEAPRGH